MAHGLQARLFRVLISVPSSVSKSAVMLSAEKTDQGCSEAGAGIMCFYKKN